MLLNTCQVTDIDVPWRTRYCSLRPGTEEWEERLLHTYSSSGNAQLQQNLNSRMYYWDFIFNLLLNQPPMKKYRTYGRKAINIQKKPFSFSSHCHRKINPSSCASELLSYLAELNPISY